MAGHKGEPNIRGVENRKRLEKMAEELGFDSLSALVHDLYKTQGLSLPETGKRLGVPGRTVRQLLIEYGIEIRSRGGPNNRFIDITPELIEEISRDGVHAVADRLGLHNIWLSRRLKEDHEKGKI